MDDLSHIDFGDDACDNCGCDCGGCDCYLDTAEPHMPDCPKATDGKWDAASCVVAVVVGLCGLGAALFFAAMIFSPR